MIAWAPVIAQDHDWDHAYLFEILRFKLSRMERCLRNGCHMHRERDAEQIRLCVLLLDRLIADDYWNVQPDGNLSNKMREQDKDLLFHTMKQHVFGWWD